VQEKAAFAKCKDNLAGADFRNRSGFDRSYIAGPERGQHALASNAQAQESGMAQNFRG
jgi:hypothetical protein